MQILFEINHLLLLPPPRTTLRAAARQLAGCLAGRTGEGRTPERNAGEQEYYYIGGQAIHIPSVFYGRGK